MIYNERRVFDLATDLQVEQNSLSYNLKQQG